jgi:arabinofuranosyltransferase
MSDDAFVTMRALDNVLHGYGLTFNPIERVQAYTHPLWMMTLALPYAVLGDAWRVPMLLGIATTTAVVAVLAKGVSHDRWAAIVAVAMLASSKSFVDYATSGLENPLVHLLLALMAWLSFRRERPRPLAAVLMASLLFLARPDAVLLGGPLAIATLVAAWRAGERRLVLVAPLGLAPAIAWMLFALVYYGDPLPNTAYAKLATGIPASALLSQGAAYVAWSWRVDPITLAGIAAGFVAGFVVRDLRQLSFALGSALYLLYVVAIGGDFMGGRFLTGPLFLAALAMSRVPFRWPLSLAGAAALLGASALSPWSPLRSGPDYVRAPPSDGVVDERGYYWNGTGWLAARAGDGPTHDFYADGLAARGQPLAVKSVIGLYGYAAGPGHHVVDRLGLADPLLARLPLESGLDWRIGHFRRAIPEGYVASVLAENQIADPEIAALYDRVRLVTRGPLWDPDRWRAIVELGCARCSF